jgi:predicted SnoaL-like aldol condensation-catalyzing enzyme
MAEPKGARNKALVLKAFDTLFNKRDYAAAERLWSPNCIQHSAHIEPGREGSINLIESFAQTLKCLPGMIVVEGDLVIAHGRFSHFARLSIGLQRTFFGSKTRFQSSAGM